VIPLHVTVVVSASVSSMPPLLTWRADVMNIMRGIAPLSSFRVFTNYDSRDVVHDRAITIGSFGSERRSITSIIFAPIGDHGTVTIVGGAHGPSFSLSDAGEAELPATGPADLPLLEQV